MDNNYDALSTNGFILIKFTGCTPSVNIGTIFIKVSASI